MKRVIAPYLGVWIGLMAVITWLTPWRDADWALHAWMSQGQPVRLSPDVYLLELDYDTDRAHYRASVCQALRRLASHPPDVPRAVALDIQFENEPSGLLELERCIEEVQRAGLRIYAAINPLDSSGNVTPDFMQRHASRLYREVLDGFGHTRFDHLFGAAKYDPYLALNSTLSVPALPIKLAEDLFGRPVMRTDEPIMLATGVMPDTQRLALKSGTLQGACTGSCLRGKLLLVGSPAADVSPLGRRAGPELLAWALSERILPADLAVARPLTHLGLLAVLVVVFTALTLWFAGWLLRRASLRMGEGMVVLTALAVALALLALLVAGMRALDLSYARVSLVVAAILLTAAVSLAFVRKRALVTELTGTPTEDGDRYDVFISYSRTADNAQWVRREIYESLCKMTTPEGRPLRLFFDIASLSIGVYWYSRLTRAIAGSRMFVAIYSEDYFDKPFCRFEVERAFIREAIEPGFVLPVARAVQHIPQQYAHVQALDAATDPNFVEALKRAIDERLKSIPAGREPKRAR